MLCTDSCIAFALAGAFSALQTRRRSVAVVYFRSGVTLDPCTGGKMVGAATKLSRTARPTHRSKHHYFVDERLGGNRISPAATLGMPPLEVFEAIQRPLEPVDLDQPAPCPPAEGNIKRDGEAWREMLAGKLRHQLGDGEVVGLRSGIPPRRRVQHSPREKYLFMKHSAPERAVGTIVE